MKISQYTGKQSPSSGDLILLADSGASANYSLKIDNLLNYTGWEELTLIRQDNPNYHRIRIVSGQIHIPSHNGGDPAAGNEVPKISFINYSGGGINEHGSLRCWGDHNGGASNTPEIILVSNRNFAILLGADGNKDGACQMGTSGPANEKFYLQYDATPTTVYNDGITQNPYGHSKRLGFVALSSGAGNSTLYSFPGIIGVSTQTGAYGVYNSYPALAELWFYSRLPEYPFTSYPGNLMGKMLYNGWNLRGKILQEKTESTTDTITIDFDSSSAKLFTATSNTLVITGINLPTTTTDFQTTNVLIKSGPFTPILYFPSEWSWGNNAGSLSAPTGLSSGQALALTLKSFETGNAGIYGNYSIHTSPFQYDSDAQAFFSAASITNSTQRVALHELVTNAKNHGWWEKCDAIYPFVGGTSGSHTFNLKSTGLYKINFNNGVAHGSFGISGSGVGAWGNTNYHMSGNAVNYTTNSGHIFMYAGNNGPIPNNGCLLGGASFNTSTVRRAYMNKNGNTNLEGWGFNNNIGALAVVGTSSLWSGAFIWTRLTSTSAYIGMRSTYVASSDSSPAVEKPNVNLGIFARNTDSSGPDNFWSGCAKGVTVGGPISSSEWDVFRADWDRFQLSLGR